MEGLEDMFWGEVVNWWLVLLLKLRVEGRKKTECGLYVG